MIELGINERGKQAKGCNITFTTFSFLEWIFWTHPELVIVSRGALFNESAIIGGYIPVVGILLQHIDLQFNFLLFILDTNKTYTHTHTFVTAVYKKKKRQSSVYLSTRKSLVGDNYRCLGTFFHAASGYIVFYIQMM